jgi:uncharacterized protein YkwD
MLRPRRPRGSLVTTGLIAALFALAFVVPPARVGAWVFGQYNGAQESLLFSMTNQARAASGAPPLRFSSALRSLARWRTKDMADRNYFAHEIPPDGRMVFAYMDQRGFSYVLAGENIGWNNAPDGQATQVIQRMFMDSPGHRANLLYRKWDSMGIGAYKGTDGIIRYCVLFMQSKRALGSVPAGLAEAAPPRTWLAAASPRSTLTAGGAPTAAPGVGLDPAPDSVAAMLPRDLPGTAAA